jgi:hypothetical protein
LKHDNDILKREEKTLKELIVTQNQEIEELREKENHYKALYLALKEKDEKIGKTSIDVVTPKEKESVSPSLLGEKTPQMVSERQTDSHAEVEELRKELELRDIQIFKLKSERERERIHRKRNDSLLFRTENDLQRTLQPSSSSSLPPPSSLSSFSSSSSSPPSSPSSHADELQSLSEVMTQQTIALETLQDELESMKKKHFFHLGWAIKSELASSGRFCNVKIDQLYEYSHEIPDTQVNTISIPVSIPIFIPYPSPSRFQRSISFPIDIFFRFQWDEWIRAQLEKNDPSSLPPPTPKPPRGLKVGEKRRGGGGGGGGSERAKATSRR